MDRLRTAAGTDVVLVAALLVVATAVRLPYLWDIPRITDESNEALKALVTAHGRLLPLTNVDPYIGPLWNYLLAGVFLATGPSLYTPRTVVAVLGILTVVPTYLFGRALGGNAVGALAAVFLALSPAHIVVNSHIAWSNCITPLLTTLALWLTQRAVTRTGPSGLAPAGIAWGLALQTHPVAFLFLPGIALDVIRAHPRWLRSKWTWMAAGLAVAACAPLVIANVRSGLGGLENGLKVQAEYAAGEPLNLASYARRLRDLVSLLTDGMSGTLGEFDPLRGPFGAPLGLVFLLLTLLGLGYALRRRAWLPWLAVVTYVALLPAVNARFESAVPKVRYVAPLLPLCYAMIGLLLVELYRRADRLPITRQWTPAERATIVRTGLIAGVASLLTGPLLGLQAYYVQDAARGRTNADLYGVIAAVNAAWRPGDQIVVDRALMQAWTPGGGRMYEHLQFAASVYGWNRLPASVPVAPDDPLLHRAGLLIVADRDVAPALITMRLQPLDADLSERSPARVFRILGPVGRQPRARVTLQAPRQP